MWYKVSQTRSVSNVRWPRKNYSQRLRQFKGNQAIEGRKVEPAEAGDAEAILRGHAIGRLELETAGTQVRGGCRRGAWS